MENNLKVILAEINGTPELEVRQAIKLRKDCEEMGIRHPVNVNSVEDLIDVLVEEKGQSILLFSNFPPDSSYLNSGKTMELVDKEEYISRSSIADSYSISQKLFSVLEKRYTFKAIHFITGVHALILKDEHFESLFTGTPITVDRKKDWKNSGKDYQELYRLLVEEKIKEALQ